MFDLMRDFRAFRDTFGPPIPGSGRPPTSFGLDDGGTLVTFAAEVGTGIFREGLLSICSTREGDGDLGEWTPYLPVGCRHFASGAFGALFALCGEDLWIVDPHYGQVLESDISLGGFFEAFADAGLLQGFLKEGLFEEWRAMSGGPLEEDVLCPNPVPALGGDWRLASLKPVSLMSLMSLTAQLLGSHGGGQIEVRRL